MIPRLHRLALLVLAGWVLFIPVAEARYGEEICNNQGFKCHEVKKGDNWQRLFPSGRDRNLVQRLNRMNTRLRVGMVIAVPKNLGTTSLGDISPFPAKIESSDQSQVFVNQGELAWGAYDKSGNLIKWGPMSGGQSYCEDIRERCATPSGQFTAFRKEGADCISKTFPLNEGGAEMPFCTFFSGGVAFHGSAEVPGFHASHGCVRMFTEDARWLNTEFVELGKTRVMVDSSLPHSPRPLVKSTYGIGMSNSKGGMPSFPWH
ncbi:MAG: hypothetical protein A2514_04130 [Gammaproteobacteria bacterium RIFOXYD12_FULL_61_37]|nr:MAG: hypothetical protein A2514_04130 [Gammaproteobacteria bacterium RIFOXYD12_FULL_61_37]